MADRNREQSQRDEESPDINPDIDDFNLAEESVRTGQSSMGSDIGQLGNFDVNPPGPEETSSSDDDNFENFHVEFGTAVPSGPVAPDSPTGEPVSQNDRDVSNDEDPEQVDLDLGVASTNDKPDTPTMSTPRPASEYEEPESERSVPNQTQDVMQLDAEGDMDANNAEEDEGEEDVNLPVPRLSFRDGTLEAASVLGSREYEPDLFPLDLGEHSTPKTDTPTGKRGTGRSPGRPPSAKRPRDSITSARATSSTASPKKRGRPRMIRGTPKPTQDETQGAAPTTFGANPKPKSKPKDLEKAGDVPKPAKVMIPAVVMSEYEKGNLTKNEAYDALIRFRVNNMLPKTSDKMYVDKRGDVRFPKGYSFGKSRDSSGKTLKKHGLTRIEREILAYQKSTHTLIPRSIFARIVREIAQGWFRGQGQIKFTVEALSALQVATEDEITKLLEISTACSYHAKRITLKVDDMRLARFCRGRQEYEFFNMNP